MAPRFSLTRLCINRTMFPTHGGAASTNRYFSDGKGRILSEEELAAEKVYIQKMERERMEKLKQKQKAEKEKAEKHEEQTDKKTEESRKS